MQLKITHTTTYDYDTPVSYALQQLRLTPRSTAGQKILDWDTQITGATRQLGFDDQYGNVTDLVKADPGTTRIEIVSQGTVEVTTADGVIGKHRGLTPLWLFENATPMTAPGPLVQALADAVMAETEGADPLDRLHALSARIGAQVAYESGRTDSDTTAEGALRAGHGVCQDHAHVMIAAARLMGHPARYVSGYLMMNDRIDQDASHAWCEVWTQTLGWVGFDVSNGISPDQRYVRVAIGRDYRDAAPIAGIRHGAGREALQVHLQVQQ